MKRVLIFAPYAGFSVHAQVDGVFGAALQQRGAQVRLVICDGVFGDCALFRGAAPARQREICASCARHGQDLASTFGLDAIQLRALIQPEDRAAARVWVEGLAPAGYLEAAYEGRPVGEWVSSTVLT